MGHISHENIIVAGDSAGGGLALGENLDVPEHCSLTSITGQHF